MLAKRKILNSYSVENKHPINRPDFYKINSNPCWIIPDVHNNLVELQNEELCNSPLQTVKNRKSVNSLGRRRGERKNNFIDKFPRSFLTGFFKTFELNIDSF